MTLGILPRGGIVDWGGPLGLIVHHGLLLFAVVNPIGNIPVYADLTRELEIRERGNVMKLAVLTSLFVVTLFALIGDWSLVYLFNVNLGELEIAGGILLFIVALRGVMAQGPVYEHPKDSRMLAVFPIAFPIMVGPGAITVTIITSGAIGQVLMVITAVVTFFFVFLVAWNADRLMRLVGPYAGMMIARLLYIFLAAKAVAMVLDGITEFVHRLSSADPNTVAALFSLP
jgi:multiple antibiotic resistance protein